MRFERTLQLFRVFVPSWRLFDRRGDVGILYFRLRKGTKGQTSEWSDWQRCLPGLQMGWRQLFDNSQGNFYLASQNLITRFLLELSTLQTDNIAEVAQLCSYQLIKNLVNYILAASLAGCSADSLDGAEIEYQFKIALSRESQPLAIEDVLVSPIYKAESL